MRLNKSGEDKKQGKKGFLLLKRLSDFPFSHEKGERLRRTVARKMIKKMVHWGECFSLTYFQALYRGPQS